MLTEDCVPSDTCQEFQLDRDCVEPPYISLNYPQVQLMVPGVPGLTGPSVPRLVVEELRAGRETVLDQPRLLVGETVLVRSLN